MIKYFITILFTVSMFFTFQIAQARDAAFIAPGVKFGSGSNEVITVEPKNEISVGDTPINLGRRATFFFVNQTNKDVNIKSIIANGDTNVKAEIVGDDCSSEKIIKASSRCSVTIEATPTDAGSWTAELLLTHDAQGRIARAKISGKTKEKKGQSKDTGLSLSTQKITPITFGDVEVNTDKAVRSALMVNDSNTPITILDIEVIAPENGLTRAEQGCAVDMDLEVGESCPITLIWEPKKRGIISTDLIIRHSGRLGFAVIPIRGIAKGDKLDNKVSVSINSNNINQNENYDDIPSVTHSNNTDAKAVFEAIDRSNISVTNQELIEKTKHSAVNLNNYYLIGTVGNRAIIYKPDRTTEIVSEYDQIKVGDGFIEIVSISPKEVVLDYLGEEETLKLTSVKRLKRIKQKRNNFSDKSSSIINQKKLNTTINNVVKLPVQK